MTYRRANATRNAACDAEAALFNGGTIDFRSGSQPADPDDADTGTVLATVTMGNPAFGAAGTVNPGEAIAEAITGDSSIDQSGTVGYAVFKRSGGSKIGDASCGGSGSGADIIFDNPVLVAGGELLVPSLTLTHPE